MSGHQNYYFVFLLPVLPLSPTWNCVKHYPTIAIGLFNPLSIFFIFLRDLWVVYMKLVLFLFYFCPPSWRKTWKVFVSGSESEMEPFLSSRFFNYLRLGKDNISGRWQCATPNLSCPLRTTNVVCSFPLPFSDLVGRFAGQSIQQRAKTTRMSRLIWIPTANKIVRPKAADDVKPA